ncbi:MAG TPA: hypothetical protein DCZ72_15700 [Armatimonadetes bacterium]|nr:hypothetical protein [Armatimonadota bacterium]
MIWTVQRRLRSWGRVNQVLTIAMRYGFRQARDLLHTARLGRRRSVPVDAQADPKLRGKSAGERLRLMLQELGPTYVKLGQLLSTRRDLVPAWAADELAKLQDQVTPLPLGTVRQVVEAELGAPLEQHFTDFSAEPLGSASLGQVHRAVTTDGHKVAVKVQRPGIERVIEDDLSVIGDLVGLLEKHRVLTDKINLRQVYEEVADQLRDELVYTIEARNAERAAQTVEPEEGVRIPKVYWPLTTSRVLCTELFEAAKLSDPDQPPDALRVDLSQRLVRFALRQILFDGFFHADLHAGNLMVFPDGKLGLIDWGQVGLLGRRMRDSLDEIFVGIATHDTERLVDEIVAMGLTDDNADLEAFRYDLTRALDRYLHLSRRDYPLGAVLARIMDLSYVHHIALPSELPMLVKVLGAVEGTCLQLNPDFDLRSELEPLVRRLIGRQFQPDQIARSTLANARHLSRLTQALPRQLANLFERVDAGTLVVKVDTDLDDPGRYLVHMVRSHSVATVACGLMIAGALALGTWPLAGQITFLAGVLAGLGLLLSVIRRPQP